jgi:hypothetical protein
VFEKGVADEEPLDLRHLSIALRRPPLRHRISPGSKSSGGYSHSSFSDGFVKRVPGNGWNAAVQYNFDKAIGLKADFSRTYGTDDVAAGQPFKVKNYTYTFGPVFAVRANRRFTPFAELLFGGYHETREKNPYLINRFCGDRRGWPRCEGS